MYCMTVIIIARKFDDSTCVVSFDSGTCVFALTYNFTAVQTLKHTTSVGNLLCTVRIIKDKNDYDRCEKRFGRRGWSFFNSRVDLY